MNSTIRLKKGLILNFLLIFLSMQSYGQVTIGSSNAPVDGALLQLKEDSTVYGNGANASKGLGLPRVALTDKNNLFPMFDTTNGADYTAGSINYNKAHQDSLHTGLILYNVNGCFDNGNGIYVWDGEEWLSMLNENSRPSYEYAITSKTGLDQPNSYIVNESGVVKIPIAKAITIWDGNTWQGDLTAGSSTLSKLLPTSKSVATMSLEAKLVWSDNCSKQFILNADSLEIKGSGSDAYIEVWVGYEKGNAVIALVEQGQDAQSNALWSWHIWATDTPSQITYNGKTWLDRSLGATSATVGDVKTIGLLYQWGRKDPMPGSADWTSKDLTIYNADGDSINYSSSTYALAAGSNATTNLTQSISHPLTYITGATSPYDWYSSVSGSSWHDRWDASNTKKSASDPCPEGWRVPNGSAVTAYPWNQTNSPWSSLTLANAGTWNYGFNFVATGAAAGYYPAAGFRRTSSGQLYPAGSRGHSWSASPYTLYGRALYYYSSNVDTWNYFSRSVGFAVRCVTE